MAQGQVIPAIGDDVTALMGMAGNIDLAKQPKVKNPDGSISTVDSRSFNIDGHEVLLPSVTPDGRHLRTDAEILAEYKKTGRHLGKFPDVNSANAYASQLHEDYAAGKFDPPVGADVTHLMSPTFKTSNQVDENGQPIVDPNTLGTFMSHAGAQVNPITAVQTVANALPIPKVLGGAGVDAPLQTVKNIGAAHGAVFDKAKAAFNEGDYLSAGRHFMDFLIPVVGPVLDKSADQMQAGKYAAGMGDAVGLALAMFSGKPLGDALAAIKVKVPGLLKNPNPVEAAAVQFGLDHDVPVDAGTASGRQFVKNLQKKAGSTWGGANTAETAKTAQAQALTRVGDELAGDVNATTTGQPGPVVDPLRAGAGATQALEDKIRGFDATASQHYKTLEKIEADPARAVSMRVDLDAIRPRLAPMHEELQRERDLVGLQGDKARAFVALDKVMNGPDWVPLSVADKALSTLKSMARSADMPELRSQGQGVAAETLKPLEAAVRATAAKAGGDVVAALEGGRKATVAKYAVADIRDLLSVNEPGKVFSELTAKKDVGIERLNAVAQHAPEQLPRIGRAVLENMLDTATEAGKFDHAGKLYADWQKLGPQTKRMLFAGQTQDIDRFFLLAKKLSENPNPSGTAQVLNATQLAAGIPSWALAKILYNPKAVPFLNRGLSLFNGPARLSPALQSAAYADIVNAASAAGVPSSLVPAFGQDPATGATKQ